MKHGIKRIRVDKFPLSLRLIREIHQVLLSTGRGSEKMPGEFRTSQNWIGGTRPGNAKFVPAPPDEVITCMGALEKFIHYDLRTNMNFTLRTNPLRRAHLDDFVACYHPENRHQRQESERFRAFSYEELLKRDKLSLDLFWMRDESLEGTDKLPPPDEIAASIVEDLQNALEQFIAITEDLRGKVNGNS